MAKKAYPTLTEIFSDKKLYSRTKNQFNRAIAEAAIRDNANAVFSILNQDVCSSVTISSDILFKINEVLKALPPKFEHSIFDSILDHSGVNSKFFQTYCYVLNAIFESASDEIYLKYYRCLVKANPGWIEAYGINVPALKRITSSSVKLTTEEYDAVAKKMIHVFKKDNPIFSHFSTCGTSIGQLVNLVSDNAVLVSVISQLITDNVTSTKYSFQVKYYCTFASTFIKSIKDKDLKKAIVRKLLSVKHPQLTSATLKTSPKLKHLLLMK